MFFILSALMFIVFFVVFFFFSSRRRHTRCSRDWSSDVCSSDLRFHERALRIREQALGPEHPDVAWSLDHLGSVLPRLGAAAAARPLYERALEIREKTLGPEHPDVAVSLGNLAGAVESSDPARARALRER